jgi:hypothetical protein
MYEFASPISGTRHTHMPYRLISPRGFSIPQIRHQTRVQENQLGQLVSENPLPSYSTFLYTPAQNLAISHLLVDLGATNYLVTIYGRRYEITHAVRILTTSPLATTPSWS